MNTVINIARDFTKNTGPRYKRLGNNSGEEFREEVLIPALDALGAGDYLEVVLDGIRGKGSSFFEEAFGGLIRAGYDPEKVLEITFVSNSDPGLIDEIESYISKAISEAKKSKK